MSAVSLVSRTAPVPVGRAICHLVSSFASLAAGVSKGRACVCVSVCLCPYFLYAATCWFLHEHQCLFVWLVCAFIWLSCMCVCLTAPLPPTHTPTLPHPPAGSVSCACCADNQCVTSAGSVQQEQGTGLISTHTHFNTTIMTVISSESLDVDVLHVWIHLFWNII